LKKKHTSCKPYTPLKGFDRTVIGQCQKRHFIPHTSRVVARCYLERSLLIKTEVIPGFLDNKEKQQLRVS
jgi:hypothetical protein